MDTESKQIVDEIIAEEGGFQETNDPADGGGRTKFGISETSNPDLWKNGPPSLDQAETRFYDRYVKGPGFDLVSDQTLKHQLVDFGVNSGPAIAIQNLQAILGVKVDGVLGPNSLTHLEMREPREVNNSLVKARILLLSKICVNNPSQLKFLVGWLNRALEFLC